MPASWSFPAQGLLLCMSFVLNPYQSVDVKRCNQWALAKWSLVVSFVFWSLLFIRYSSILLSSFWMVMNVAIDEGVVRFVWIPGRVRGRGGVASPLRPASSCTAASFMPHCGELWEVAELWGVGVRAVEVRAGCRGHLKAHIHSTLCRGWAGIRQ